MDKSSKLHTVGLTLAGLCMAVSSQLVAGGVVEVNAGGLFQADAGAFRHTENDYFADGAQATVSDIWLSGHYTNLWSYKLGYRLSDRNIRDAWVAYKGFKPLHVLVGQFAPPQGLESEGGDANHLFVSKAAANQLWGTTDKMGLGVMAKGHSDLLSYQLAAWVPGTQVTRYGFDSDVSDWEGAPDTTDFTGGDPRDYADAVSGGDPLAYSVRVTATPIHTDEQVLHVGGSFLSQDAVRNPTSVKVVPGFGLRSTPALLDDTDYYKHFNVLGLEAAGIWGPVYAQAEWQQARYKVRDYAINGDNRRRNAWYVQGSYVLTGESHNYRAHCGSVGGVDPRSSYGAMEVALRYDVADFRQNNVTGNFDGVTTIGAFEDANPSFISGPADYVRSWTLGANYYVTKNLRFLANLATAHASYVDAQKGKRVQAVGLRMQFDV